MLCPQTEPTRPIPFNDLRPALLQTEARWRQGIEGVVQKGNFILGDELACFESEFAKEMGARFAVGVSSGTAAIELSLRAHDVPRGAEVLTTALTAPFTAVALMAAGCKPMFADVDPDTLLLDSSDAVHRISRQTKAVVPVHLYGQPCDLSVISRAASDAGAVLIQDACQAHGARFGAKPFTSTSDYVAYSFYPTKNLGCLGDGGAVVTDSAAAARRLRVLRDGGRTRDHVVRTAGINARLDEIQAAFLRAFLPELPGWNAARLRLAHQYAEELRGCPGVRVISQRPGSVYHLFVIRAQRRRSLREYLARFGIGTAIHYPVPLHLHPGFRDCGLRRGDLPQSEKACREILSLPLWPTLPEHAVSQVAGRIRDFYTGCPGRSYSIPKPVTRLRTNV